jgi:catalase (peroxidase I)
MSESENPAIPSPTPQAHRPRTNKDWWPDQVDLSVLHKQDKLSNPMGADFNYAEEFKKVDDLAGLVASRLRHLWRALDPDELARGWHVPHPRRPRRRR